MSMFKDVSLLRRANNVEFNRDRLNRSADGYSLSWPYWTTTFKSKYDYDADHGKHFRKQLSRRNRTYKWSYTNDN